MRRGTLIAAAVLGVGLALAPVAFRMFERAPKGGDMIDGFRPYMSESKIDEFRSHLADIGAAQTELAGLRVRFGEAAIDQHAGITTFERQWPGIDDDMGSMLTTMQRDIGRYEGVAALPPFPLFPWFFVIPGLLIAGVAGWWWRTGRSARGALVALGIGLVAAPAVFQMFSRAPGGAEMIDDFKPFMTTEKVVAIQGYFLTIGAGEGQLRRDVMPHVTPEEFPAIALFVERWPTISNDMAPMIGTMSDNVDNFDAVVALPPFWLFPWFFVAPGVSLIVLVLSRSRAGGLGRPGRPAVAREPEPQLEGVPS